MFELKRLSPETVDSAHDKAVHYRLLNQPYLAESICRDILAVDPDHQPSLVTLVLTLCDQLGKDGHLSVAAAMEVVREMDDEYARAYYSGIVCERRAFAQLRIVSHASGHVAYEWFHKAMEHYEEAERLRPAGNDDALLRWNTCARTIDARADVHSAHEPAAPFLLE